jgi:hypothetical protein
MSGGRRPSRLATSVFRAKRVAGMARVKYRCIPLHCDTPRVGDRWKEVRLRYFAGNRPSGPSFEGSSRSDLREVGARVCRAGETAVVRDRSACGLIAFHPAQEFGLDRDRPDRECREAQILIEQWRRHYNTVRPHSALRYRPPAAESTVPMDERPWS